MDERAGGLREEIDQRLLAQERARRIVVLGPAFPYRGGIAQFADSMSRELGRRGHQVHVITFNRQYPEFLFPGKSQFERASAPSDRDPAPGVRLERLLDSINPLSWLQVARRIAGDRPNVVFIQYWMPFLAPAYTVIARRLKRLSPHTNLIGIVHNVLPHERRPADATLARWFLKACDSIIVLSESVARDARKLVPQARILTLSHPVYEHFGTSGPRGSAREHLDIAADAEVMLFFGFVRAYKGLHVLLEAMPRIARARPKATLIVAGEFYEDESRYRQQIVRHGLESRVRMDNEYIPAEKVAAYFSAADVVVQPYTSATQSGVVQTAFHFERPVIVTNVGGLAEVVGDGQAGLVVPPGDSAALAAACIRFFEEDLGERLEAGVRNEKREYQWNEFVRAVEDMPAFDGAA